MRGTVRVPFKGSPDGLRTYSFRAGEAITVRDARMSENLWATAVTEGWLEPEPTQKAPPPNKALSAPSNKGGIRHAGGGWYELPTGDKIRGEGAALAALAKMKE